MRIKKTSKPYVRYIQGGDGWCIECEVEVESLVGRLRIPFGGPKGDMTLKADVDRACAELRGKKQ